MFAIRVTRIESIIKLTLRFARRSLLRSKHVIANLHARRRYSHGLFESVVERTYNEWRGKEKSN